MLLKCHGPQKGKKGMKIKILVEFYCTEDTGNQTTPLYIISDIPK